MFDIGFSELVLVALLALIVLGPKRLPEVARTAGRWMGSLRRFVSNVRTDFDREMRNAEIMELQKLKQEFDDTRRILGNASDHFVKQLGTLNPEESAAVTSAVGTAQVPLKQSETKTKRASAGKRQHGRSKKTKPRRR